VALAAGQAAIPRRFIERPFTPERAWRYSLERPDRGKARRVGDEAGVERGSIEAAGRGA